MRGRSGRSGQEIRTERANEYLYNIIAMALHPASTQPIGIPKLAAGIAASIRQDAVADQLRRLPPAALDRLEDAVRDVLESVLPDLLETDPEHLAAIRRFLLEPQETYSIEELAALWRLPYDDIRNIYHDELLLWEREHGTECDPRIAWADSVGTSLTFNLIRPFDVETALDSDFPRARPDAWRTVPVLIRLPLFIAEFLPSEAHISTSQNLAEHVERFILEIFECEHRRLFKAAADVDNDLRMAPDGE